MTDVDSVKRSAALAAADLVASGMRVGLGTGSTARHVTDAIGERLADGRLDDVTGVATSEATALQAQQLGIPLIDPWSPRAELRLDIAIDGADEIAPDLAVTKGHGGALLREKIVAAAATRFVVVADSSKLVDALGSRCAIPLEVSGFGVDSTLRHLTAFGSPRVRLETGSAATSDNGNLIVDLTIEPVTDVPALDAALAVVPGVLGTGLFYGLVSVAFVAGPDGVRKLSPG